MYERIKELCRKHGITVTELERATGLSRGSICKVDKNKPGFDRVKKIADYFGVPPESLTDDHAENPRHYINDETLRMAQEIHDNRDLRIMFDSARNLSPEDLKFAVDFLKRIEQMNKK